MRQNYQPWRRNSRVDWLTRTRAESIAHDENEERYAELEKEPRQDKKTCAVNSIERCDFIRIFRIVIAAGLMQRKDKKICAAISTESKETIGNRIMVYPVLPCGRKVPIEGIELDIDVKGAVPYLQGRIYKELRTCQFSLLLGKIELPEPKANTPDAEIPEGATLKIMRTTPSQEQVLQWRKLALSGGEVKLNVTSIKTIGWPTIEQALTKSHEEIVQFASCGLCGADAEIIAEAAKANSCMRRLYLDRNEIGDAGAVALAQAIEVNKTLSFIALTQNNIKDYGAIAIAKAVEANEALKVIFLAENKITDDGAIAIAKALKHNSTLEKIWLNANNIKDDGAVALAEAIQANAALKDVWMLGNSFGNIGRTALERAQKTRNEQGRPVSIVF